VENYFEKTSAVIPLKSGLRLFHFGNADSEEGSPPPWVFSEIIDLEKISRKILEAQQVAGKILFSKNLRLSRLDCREPVAPHA
jgi:hypothetical protein